MPLHLLDEVKIQMFYSIVLVRNRRMKKRQMSRHVCTNWRHKNIFSTSKHTHTKTEHSLRIRRNTQEKKSTGAKAAATAKTVIWYMNAIFYISRRIKYFINMNVCICSCMQCRITQSECAIDAWPKTMLAMRN